MNLLLGYACLVLCVVFDRFSCFCVVWHFYLFLDDSRRPGLRVFHYSVNDDFLCLHVLHLASEKLRWPCLSQRLSDVHISRRVSFTLRVLVHNRNVSLQLCQWVIALEQLGLFLA